MALRLTIVGRNGARIGTSSVKEFGPGGGTIGRSLECDWVLPDTKRYLSSRHASIDFRSGSYYIVDTSMNGVYVNDAEQPVGRGKPQRLFDGDRLRIGEYEISVEVDEDPISPLIEEDHIDPVDLAQRVEAPEPTGNDMVDAYEITGVGIEMMLTDDELETLSPPPRSKGAYFEIVDDDASAHTPSREPSARAAAKPDASADALELADATQPAMLSPARPAARAPARPAAAASPTPPAREPGAATPGVTAAPAAPKQPAANATPATAPRPAVRQPPAAAAQKPPATAPTPAAAAQNPAAAAKPTVPDHTSTPQRPARARPTADVRPPQPAAEATAAKPPPQVAGATAAAKPPPQPAAGPAAAASPSPQVKAAPVSAEKAIAPQPTPLHARGFDLAPFFKGAGIAASVPPQQIDAFLFRLGQVMRTMIGGLTESLHLRAEQKNALRLPSTTIQPQDNNPLKLSAGVEEAFVNLLLRDSAAHLPPVDAVREAFDDLQLHQQLVLKAIRAALEAFVSRLDPDELEHKFARGRSNMLVNAANKLKYWDLYKDLYDVVAHHPPGELPLQFLEDFAQAYEQELAHARDASAPAAERQAG